MSVEASTKEIYVEQGNKITVYNPTRQRNRDRRRPGCFNNQSCGVAVNPNNHHVFANEGNNIIDFGYEPKSVPGDRSSRAYFTQPNRWRSTARSDFQITPNGDDAIFTARVLSYGETTAATSRSTAMTHPSGALDCVSCTPTSAVTTGDAFLAPNGHEPHRGRARLLHTRRSSSPCVTPTARRTPTNGKGVPDQPDLHRYGSSQRRRSPRSTRPARTPTSSRASRSSPRTKTAPTMKVYTAREGGGFRL